MRVLTLGAFVLVLGTSALAQAPALTDEAREFFSNVVQHAYDLGFAEGRAEERVRCGRVL